MEATKEKTARTIGTVYIYIYIYIYQYFYKRIAGQSGEPLFTQNGAGMLKQESLQKNLHKKV